MLKHVLLALLLSLALPAHAESLSPADTWQAIRSAAFSLCSNLLLYYNPEQPDSDPRHREAYRQGLASLEQLIGQTGEAAMNEPLQQMREQIDLLERHADADRLLKPRWVIPTLQAQARLDQLAAARYAQVAPDAPLVRSLHEQSLDVSRMLLMYQIHTFGSLAVYFMEVDDATPSRLDREIGLRFERMLAQWPDLKDQLVALGRDYDFIRPRLLQRDKTWVSGSAAYYLGRIATHLDRLAEVAGSGQAQGS
jgi:hypothetical protein